MKETKECQFCLSEIPLKAQKCRYCHEWLDFEENMQFDDNSNSDNTDYIVYENLKKPFQLKLIEKIPLHYAVSIFIIGIIIFGIIQLFWYLLDEERVYLLSILSFTIQMMFSWGALIWVNKVINDNYFSFINTTQTERKTSKELFLKYHSKTFDVKNSIIAGLIVGLVASIGDSMVGYPFSSTEAKIIFAVFEFTDMFFAGAAIYSMINFAIFLYITTSKENISSVNNDQINKIGSIHLKTSVLAIVPLFLGIIAKLFGNWNWDILNILWYSSFAVIIIIYIYWPMLNIHRLLQEDINNKIIVIKTQINNILNEINLNPSPRAFIKLNELRQFEKTILHQKTWPFDKKSISAAFFAIFVPILLMLIDKIWSI